MKKFLIISILLISVSTLFSQVTKTERISRIQKNYIAVTKEYKADGSLRDIYFMFLGQNGKYDHIIDLVDMEFGTAQDVYDFLRKVKDFTESFKGEYNVSTDIDITTGKVNAFHCNILGATVRLESNNGYIYLKDKDIQSHMNNLVKYCEKNGVEINP